MPTTIRKAGPADLIALVWFRLGYRPRESLVLVGLEGPRRRSGLISRVDLPDARGTEPARRMLEVLRRSGAGAVVVLVASEQPALAPIRGRPPVVRTIRREARRQGIGLVDALWVGAEGYRSYLCRDPQCCPLDGHPLADVMASPAAAAAVLDGQVVAEDEADLVADVVPDPDDRADEGSGDRAPPGRGDGVPGQADVAGWLRLWRRCLVDGAIAADAAAGLAAAMDDVLLRDAVMVTFLPDPGALPEAMLDFGKDRAATEKDWTPLAEAVNRPPDLQRLAATTALLAVAARSAPPGTRAPVLGCLAWVAWWAGEGARARLLVGMALADRPGYPLAMLVDEALLRATPPPWVGAPDVGEVLNGLGLSGS